MKDTRVVYGAVCTWWDTIDKVSTTQSGLPCCPHCGGVLYQMESEEEMRSQNARISKRFGIDYQAAMDWCRDKCSRALGWELQSSTNLPPIYVLYQREQEAKTP